MKINIYLDKIVKYHKNISIFHKRFKRLIYLVILDMMLIK